MRKKCTLFSILCLVSILHINAQTIRTITGTVKDSKSNETIPGVSVFVKEDNTNGTVTDIDGKFSLDIPSTASTLIFRYVGYFEIEKPVTAGSVMDISMDAANVNLDAFVISASRREEKILDAPASISLITAQQIKNTVAISPTDNLKGTPGVDVMNTGLVQTNVVTRGFNNIFSGALLTMVDNRYATVPSLRVNINMFIPTDNTDLDRIEVLRGPASALYGPNCSNGVLHMITKSPIDQEKKFTTTFSAGIGFRSKIDDTIAISNPIDPSTGNVYLNYTPQFDYESIGDRLMYTAAFRHSGRISEKFGYKILTTYFSGTDWLYDDPLEPNRILKGYQTSEGRQNDPDSIDNIRNNSLEKIGLDGRLDFRPKDDIEIIFASGITQNDGIELTGIGAGQAVNWKYYYSQLRFRNKRLFAQAFINGSNSGETFILRTGDYITDQSKVMAGQVQYSSDLFNKDLYLVYGIDALLTRPNTNGTINGRNEEDDEITEIGAYVQGDYKINEQFNIIGALRYDYHNFVDDPFFSPRAALVYKPNAKQTFRATFNRSFSAPSSNNLNLDILQLVDLGGLGAFGQDLFSLDYLPSIGARAVGNRGGFTFSYDENGLPQFHSPYALAMGDPTDQYYSLGENSILNNYTWDVAVNLLYEGIVDASGLNLPTVKSIFGPFLPSDISGIANNTALLNLTTGEFEPIDPSTVQDFGGIRNSATNTYEIGWKGALADSKLFVTLDVYRDDKKDFVSPLTNITPNVFLDAATLTSYVAPYITEVYNDTLYSINASLVDASFDANDDGSGLEEFIATVVGAGAGVPMGTIVPTQYDDASLYVTYVNIGDVTVYGSDLGVTYYVNDDLKISFAYSWVDKDSIPVEGAQLGYVALNAPKNKIGVRASYDINKIDMNVGLTFRWQESFPANSGAYVGPVDDVHDMDLTLNYFPDFWNDSQFSFLITNLYNHEQQYFVGSPVIGRTMFFKVTKSF
ncbi:MAG: TonB-dependent receptor [Fimbriimonadaceae bacterium]|nr:TonB-dependent receptor [Chitinophagales bacterium]